MGSWKDSERHGEGREEGKRPQPDCGAAAGLKTYVGNFSRNTKRGFGKATYTNGDEYEGEWDANVRTGHGVCRFGNGDVYEGKWENDVRSGAGKCTYANGEVYEGEWRDNVRHVASDNWQGMR